MAFNNGCSSSSSSSTVTTTIQPAFRDTEPWFPYHETRDQYYALQAASPPATEAQLKAALLRRAMTDVERIFDLREQKGPLQQLAKSGTVGDDLWHEFVAAESGMEQELQEVVAEANEFKPGWGESIFQTATDMLMHQRQTQLYEDFSKQRAEAARERERRLVREKEESASKEAQKKLKSENAAKELIQEEEEKKDASGSGLRQRH